MEPIRVLMVTVTFGEGSGVNTFIMNYFRNINHDRVHIDVLTYKESPTGKSPFEFEVETAGGKVFLLPNIKNFKEHLTAIVNILNTGKYDVIHNNSLIMTIPLMLLCKKYGIKVRILHSHATKMGETKTKEIRNKLLLPFLKYSCNYYLACSNAAGKAMFGNMKYDILPNVIDYRNYYFNKTNRNRTREEKYVSGRIVILSVGRICEQKNPFFAIQVIKKLKIRRPNITYWWVGDGPLIYRLKEKVKELELEDITVFWGKQSNMREFYEASDIFFLPSLFEGLPLTGVEAQAMGLPSIVSDTVTKEMVFTDLVRYVGLADSIDKWVEALEKQILRINERRSYVPELLNSFYSNENAGTRMENIYEKYSHM